MAHTENIFKATYSNVPVYEMPCKGVAVMKRRSDGWLNATQILKVAGFDKPQRTRVLEREVQKGTHEKVQGGYGKYQGTWIPPDRGLSLSKQYMVDHLLQPIIDYIPPPGASPPPAPKHATAAPKGPRQKRTATPAGQPAPSRQRAPPRGPDHPLYVDSQLSKVEIREDAEISPVQTDGAGGSTASRTPSPLASEAQSDFDSLYTQSVAGNMAGAGGRKRKHDRLGLEDPSMMHQHQQQMALAAAMQSQGGPAVYARMILDYFVSESAQIPSFLISPPADFDPNVVIDDDGHTALHWACAMGRIRIVKLLLTAGADIFRANAMGQTALMRSVMFTNNYDLRKFPELFELLHRSTINIDRNDRTVFHYIVDIALQKGKAHAARYYLEVVLERLKEYPREVADILNFQDEEGETALTLAARARSKNLVRVLLNHGADPKIANRDGKSAEDYILEDERFRSGEQAMNPHQQQHLQQQQHQHQMPPMPPAQYSHHPQIGMQQQHPQMMHPPTMRMPDGQEAHYLDQQHQQAGQPPLSAGLPTPNNGFYAPLPVGMPPLPQPGMPYPADGVQLIPQQHQQQQLHLSETGQRVATQVIPQVTEQLETLASAYDAELEDKEREIAQAHALLNSIQAETVENQRHAAALRVQADTLEDCRAQEQQLQNELKDKMGKRFRLGWEKYVRDEEDRQKQFVSIAKPQENGNGPQAHTINFNNGGLQSMPPDLQHIFAPISNSTSQNGTNGVMNGDSDGQLSSAITAQNDLLLRLKKTRKDLFDNYAKLQADSGTGEKFAKYRKLIALGCGIDAQDVDESLVRNLLDSLDNGDELPIMAQPVQQQQQQQGYAIEGR